ncbi:hypothetical protein [Desulfonatronovibrio hydrogenovorans]|uniref:hypothetical protein n=1 Tax=Desulfonatronovibrio hydrogenovorans TaxID=53245 RepID=UPI00048A9079|nr:hypothetical protein [Desulfonatronovibrio hydrogenovorans]
MSQEKIKPVGEENLAASNPAYSAEELGGGKRDMGKVGVIVSVLAVFLLIIFYYALNKNMDEISGKVDLITETREMIQDLDNKMVEMDARIAEIEQLPDVVKNMVLGGMLDEMAQKAGYIGGQVSEEQKAKLEQARDLLQQVQQELSQ